MRGCGGGCGGGCGRVFWYSFRFEKYAIFTAGFRFESCHIFIAGLNSLTHPPIGSQVSVPNIYISLHSLTYVNI